MTVLTLPTRWTPQPPPLAALVQALAAEVAPAYVVGGVVRDLLLGRGPAKDIDVVTAHSAIPVAQRLANRLGWAFYALDEGRDVARLVFTAGREPLVCDMAGLRGGSIEADLRARDFTVNALAFELSRGSGGSLPVRLVDVTGGLEDLRAGRIRRVSAGSLPDDPLRLLRAVRFSVNLGFPIEPATRDQMLRMPAAVRQASAERVRDELWNMLAGGNPAGSIEIMHGLGLLPFVLPEVAATDLVGQSAPHDRDVYQHTLMTMRYAAALRNQVLGRPAPPDLPPGANERLSLAVSVLEPWAFYLRQHFGAPVAAGRLRGEWLVWHALLHDVGKVETRTVETTADGSSRVRFLEHERVGAHLARARVEALRFSRDEVDLVDVVVRGHMRPHLLHASFAHSEITRRARYRFFRDISRRTLDRPPGVDVLLLALADVLGMNSTPDPAAWRAYLVHVAQMLTFVYSEQGIERPTRAPLLDGRTLMQELALPPGPQVGALLEQLAEAQGAGEISTPAEALALARLLVIEPDS